LGIGVIAAGVGVLVTAKVVLEQATVEAHRLPAPSLAQFDDAVKSIQQVAVANRRECSSEIERVRRVVDQLSERAASLDRQVDSLSSNLLAVTAELRNLEDRLVPSRRFPAAPADEAPRELHLRAPLLRAGIADRPEPT
jgi:hypothetical protein